MSSNVRSDILSRLSAIARDLTLHEPTQEQKRAKATFWSHFQAAEAAPPTEVDLALALRHSGDPRVSKWWSLPGFSDWFQNGGEFRQRVEYLANMALDGLEDVLRDRNANATAKINAIKLIMEIGQKIPSKQSAPEYADEKIGKMGKQELEAFIAKNVTRIVPAPGLTISANPDNISESESPA